MILYAFKDSCIQAGGDQSRCLYQKVEQLLIIHFVDEDDAFQFQSDGVHVRGAEPVWS